MDTMMDRMHYRVREAVPNIQSHVVSLCVSTLVPHSIQCVPVGLV